MTKNRPPPEQFGFLETFDRQAQERATAHLPADMENGIAVYRDLLEKFDAAMKAVDMEAAEAIYEEAHQLAVKLNNGERGIIADDDAPGCVLARETASAPGTVPLWGQDGEFEITIGRMRVRIALAGMMGVGWLMPSFSTHAVEFDRPFLSHTGYRSFYGLRAPPDQGMTPVEWVKAIVTAYVHGERKGKLVSIDHQYRNADALPDPTLP